MYRYRQLKKYNVGSSFADVDADNGNAVAAYDNTADYSHGDSAYDTVVYKTHPSKGDVVYTNTDDDDDDDVNGNGGGTGWYNKSPVLVAPKSAAQLMATVTRIPAQKISAAMSNRASVAVIALIMLAKLKAIKALKFLLLLAIKLKLLVLLKMFLFAKSFLIGKLFRFAVLPFVPGLVSMLFNMSMPRPSSMSMSMPDQVTYRNSSGAEPQQPVVRSTDRDGVAATVDLLQFLAAVTSAECVQKSACGAAGTRPPSFRSVWTDW